jgi:uncharacterized protein (TIGR00369 family)
MSEAERVRDVLASQPMPRCAELTPFEILDANFEDGFVRVEFAPQPAFRNHFGDIQGGFGVAMVDLLVSIAAYAKTGQWMPTIEIKSSFVAPAKLGACVGEGRVVKAGRNLVFMEARLWGADGRLAIHAMATAIAPAA